VAACNNSNLRDNAAWYNEGLNVTRAGEYFVTPSFKTTPSGGVWIESYTPGAGATVDGAYDRIFQENSLDGGRQNNTVSPYSIFVSHPTESGAWTGVSLAGRVFVLHATGLVETIFGPKGDRSQLFYGAYDPNVTAADTITKTTFVGSTSGFSWVYDIAVNDLCYDPRNLSVLYLAATTGDGGNCIIKVDLTGPTATIYAGQQGSPGYAESSNPLTAQFNEPYSIIMDPTGIMYVADFQNGAIRKISAAGSVTTLVGGQAQPSAATVVNNVDTYSAPGTVSFSGGATTQYTCYPTCIRFSSAGHIVLGEQYTLCVRDIDPVGKTIRRIGSFANNVGNGNGGANFLWIDVNTAGSVGPVDDIDIIDFVNVGNAELVWRVSFDGTSTNGIGGPGSDNGIPEGPANVSIEDMGHYPWFVAHDKGGVGYPFSGGRAAQARMLSGGSVTSGVSSRRPRLSSDPPFSIGAAIGTDPAFQRGQDIFFNGTLGGYNNPGTRWPFGSRPSFMALLGETGQGLLGSSVILNFDDVVSAYPDDASLGTYIQAGFGGSVPRPEITGRDLRDLIYYIRRCSLAGTYPTCAVPGTGSYDYDVTPPVISSVSAARISSTHIQVTWTTDKVCIGFGCAGSTSSAGTNAPYSVWQLENLTPSTYATSHSVDVLNCPTGTLHYAVFAKDLAGNSTASTDFTIA
jgi:hypothetical protein